MAGHAEEALVNPCKDSPRAKNKDGYHVMGHGGLFSREHREVYSRTHDNYIFKPGDVVMHQCDNSWCVEPTHLKLGTVAENNRDKGLRGRVNARKGSAHHNTELTEEDVREIRFQAEYHTYKELGKMYNITPQAISMIVRRINWKHVK